MDTDTVIFDVFVERKWWSGIWYPKNLVRVSSRLAPDYQYPKSIHSNISPIFDDILCYPTKTSTEKVRRQVLPKALPSKQMETFIEMKQSEKEKRKKKKRKLERAEKREENKPKKKKQKGRRNIKIDFY